LRYVLHYIIKNDVPIKSEGIYRENLGNFDYCFVELWK
jgi:hypothetical protein